MSRPCPLCRGDVVKCGCLEKEMARWHGFLDKDISLRSRQEVMECLERLQKFPVEFESKACCEDQKTSPDCGVKEELSAACSRQRIASMETALAESERQLRLQTEYLRSQLDLHKNALAQTTAKVSELEIALTRTTAAFEAERSNPALAQECKMLREANARLIETEQRVRVELNACRAKAKLTVAALEAILRSEPAQNEGFLFYPRHDGEGNWVGDEPCDPITLIQSVMFQARQALEAIKDKPVWRVE